MTDRELIEWAARAAGLTVLDLTLTIGGRYMVRLPDGRLDYWNPLTDDGDALRLAVKLGMALLLGGDTSDVSCNGHGASEAFYERSSDKAAATRLAIVRAAALLGRAASPSQQEQTK